MHESTDEPAFNDTRVAVVIEDDHDIRDLIVTVFQQSGFEVHGASDGTSGVRAVREYDPTVVTLDLGLPDFDGFEVARQIRMETDCYIIMLSARTEEAETLMGLNAGADDFIVKPFRPRELRARIAAMLRRPRHSPGSTPQGTLAPVDDSHAEHVQDQHPDPATGPGRHQAPESDGAGAEAAEQPRQAEPGTLTFGALLLDPDTRTVTLNDQAIDLTRTEFELLQTLMASARRVRTKTDLVRHLRADPYSAETYVSEADERAVEVHIGNVRRKLGGNSASGIETVRGVGYRMATTPPKTS